MFIGNSTSVARSLSGRFKGATYLGSRAMNFQSYFSNIICDTFNQDLVPADYVAQNYNTFGKVYIVLGMNDTYLVEATNFKDMVLKLVRHVKQNQPGAVIYMESSTPVEKSIDGDSAYPNNRLLKKIASVVYEVCKEEGCYFLDSGSAVMNAEGRMPDGVTSDGIHFGETQVAQIEDYLVRHTVEVVRK